MCLGFPALVTPSLGGKSRKVPLSTDGGFCLNADVPWEGSGHSAGKKPALPRAVSGTRSSVSTPQREIASSVTQSSGGGICRTILSGPRGGFAGTVNQAPCKEEGARLTKLVASLRHFAGLLSLSPRGTLESLWQPLSHKDLQWSWEPQRGPRDTEEFGKWKLTIIAEGEERPGSVTWRQEGDREAGSPDTYPATRSRENSLIRRTAWGNHPDDPITAQQVPPSTYGDYNSCKQALWHNSLNRKDYNSRCDLGGDTVKPFQLDVPHYTGLPFGIQEKPISININTELKSDKRHLQAILSEVYHLEASSA
ncbi:uncharacterized protein LOC116271694 [Papio anubis]|uniref:uncharacterized protein LOC116271694 n=1 Tax=Papio anubis TaxID=9555 RepID=UPI0012AD45D0|nr:uncharacterized protein LOC116271694 [Papio anubis]